MTWLATEARRLVWNIARSFGYYEADLAAWPRRIGDALAFGLGFVFRRILLFGHGSLLLWLIYLVVQGYANEPNYQNVSQIPIVGSTLAKLAHDPNYPGAKGFIALTLGLFTSLLLIIPNIREAVIQAKQQARDDDTVKRTINSELQTILGELVRDLKSLPEPEKLRGNVRANIVLVRRHVLFFRGLEHIVSSRAGRRQDRHIVFGLAEGLPGHAYGRPGTMLVESYDKSARKVRKSLLETLSDDSKVIAARAISYAPSDPDRPSFNKVVGVIVFTSTDPTDEARFKTDPCMDIIELAVAGLFPRLVRLRKAYDGY